jgi:hypothetical protein
MLLGLIIPVQSVPISTNVVSSNPVHGEVYTISDKLCQWFSLGTPVSSTNKTDRHDITEMRSTKYKFLIDCCL